MASSTLAALLLLVNGAHSFSTVTPFIARSSSRTTSGVPSLHLAAEADDDDDVTCFIVNDEDIILDEAKPEVVCTSEPDDYAWFEGIERKKMRETDGTESGAEECVETASYKGKPEWECK